jgi:hypothetical protein
VNEYLFVTGKKFLETTITSIEIFNSGLSYSKGHTFKKKTIKIFLADMKYTNELNIVSPFATVCMYSESLRVCDT